MRTVRMPRRSRPVRGRSNRSVRACLWHRMVPYAEPGVRAEGRCRCCDQGRSLRPPVNNGDVPSQTELRSALRTSAGKLPELPILKTFLFRGSGGRVDLWSRRRAWVSAHRLRLCRWRSEEHTSELQSLLRNSYTVF